MIRPSPGGFVYSKAELKVMELDIVMAANSGANGVVFGVLNRKDEVDYDRNLRLMKVAKSFNLGTTFHRAIDVCSAPLKEIEKLIKIGFDRLLTSGFKPKAIQGI